MRVEHVRAARRVHRHASSCPRAETGTEQIAFEPQRQIRLHAPSVADAVKPGPDIAVKPQVDVAVVESFGVRPIYPGRRVPKP